MKTKTYQLETVSCPSCVAKIEGVLARTKGVELSEVLFNSSRVKVTFDEAQASSDAIRETISKLGYQVLSEK